MILRETWSGGEEILAVVTRGLLGSVEGRGLDRAALLAAAGLSEEQIQDPDQWVPIEHHAALGRAINEALPGENLGLQTGARIYGDPRGVLGYVVRRSGYHRRALEHFCAYQGVVNRALRVDLVTSGVSSSPEAPVDCGVSSSPATLQLRMEPSLEALGPPAEALFSAWVAISRHLTGTSWRPVEVSFVHAVHGEVREHRDFFDCPVNFSGERSAMVIPAEALTLPIAVTPHELEARLLQAWRTARGRLTDPGEQGALDEVLALLSGGSLVLAALAREDLREARVALARALRSGGLARFEAAFLLGLPLEAVAS